MFNIFILNKTGEVAGGIDSAKRGSKIVLEFLFALVFGLPPLVAAYGALLDSSVNPSASVFKGVFFGGALPLLVAAL